MKTNQKGFSVIEILIVIVIVGLLGAVGWRVYDHQKSTADDRQTNAQASQSKKEEAVASVAPAGELVKTTDSHAQFTLPASWKVVQRHNGEDGQEYCGFAAADEATQGICLLDVTYQPSALDTGGQTLWYAKLFKTTKSPAKWYADTVGDCKNPQEKHLKGYRDLVCNSSDHIVSNGQYLAEFVVFTDRPVTRNYQADFNSIISSIQFN